jgi:hypothetical protein
MAKKTSKATIKPKARRKTAPKVVLRKLSTQGLVKATKAVQNRAEAIRKRLSGDASGDETKLTKFIAILDEVRDTLGRACEEISSGNPMFENFRIKK